MGSKSENLKLLQSAGFQVPPFFDVPTSCLNKRELEEMAAKKLGTKALFAVRSSASVEDGKDKSFAGHFCSVVGVSFNEVFDAFSKVSESLEGINGKVIIQQFIPSEKSGVLFTNNGQGLVVVNSNFGLCKTVVEGQSCDEWYLNGENKLIRKKIASEKRPLELINNELTNTGKRSDASLTINELNDLVVECRKIETYFRYPQDIEWCFYNRKLYILQSRPITRKLPVQNFLYFDSANIAESYSGIVLPLTQSFATRIYKVVYENLLIASGVSRKKTDKHSGIFNSLVAGYYGRIFYNMNSWYLMMSFLPGYKRNKQNLEKMLTMNVSEDIIRRVNPSLGLKLRYPFVVIWKLIFFNRTIRQFERETRMILQESRQIDFSTYAAAMCWAYYRKLEEQLLNNFHIPVENDFLLMTYLGILRKKHPEQELREMLAFESVSSSQVDSIAALSHKLYQVEEFKEAIEVENVTEFQNLIREHKDMKKEIEEYFSRYSGRFANELKLESEDIESDHLLFLKLLKAYRNKKTANKTKTFKNKGFLQKRFYKYASKREDLRLLRSNCFSLVRRVFLRLGEIYARQGKLANEKDVFYCTIDELELMNKSTDGGFSEIIEKRKKDFEEYKALQVPAFFALTEDEMPHLLEEESNQKYELSGRPCNDGIITGKIRVFQEFEMPDVIDFDIIVAKNTDPGWSLLMGLSKGMIIENGGILSHAAIVSRELGIPTIIGVEAATKKLRTGQIVELNASDGTIKIMES